MEALEARVRAAQAAAAESEAQSAEAERRAAVAAAMATAHEDAAATQAGVAEQARARPRVCGSAWVWNTSILWQSLWHRLQVSLFLGTGAQPINAAVLMLRSAVKHGLHPCKAALPGNVSCEQHREAHMHAPLSSLRIWSDALTAPKFLAVAAVETNPAISRHSRQSPAAHGLVKKKVAGRKSQEESHRLKVAGCRYS